jgi:hypothetical protein
MKMTVFWMLGRVVWEKFADVSEVLSASVIRAMSLSDYTAQHPRRVIFVFAAVRT